MACSSFLPVQGGPFALGAFFGLWGEQEPFGEENCGRWTWDIPWCIRAEVLYPSIPPLLWAVGAAVRNSTGFLSLAVEAPSPRGDGILVGGTCMDLESKLKSLLFTDVSNPVGNLLMLFSFAASHGHNFQIFATSHVLISVLNQSLQVSLSTLWHLH